MYFDENRLTDAALRDLNGNAFPAYIVGRLVAFALSTCFRKDIFMKLLPLISSRLVEVQEEAALQEDERMYSDSETLISLCKSLSDSSERPQKRAKGSRPRESDTVSSCVTSVKKYPRGIAVKCNIWIHDDRESADTVPEID